MNCKNKSFMTKKKAFTLIELLIVIAIIGIIFIVLVSKVDFATDKAKATGVQTDFRSFQLAFETVSRENAGFNTFGWDTGDLNQDGIRNSYDEGDTNKNGKQDADEVFTGHKVYAETFTGVYSLKKNGTGDYDRDALSRLETAINANLDPKLHINIADDGTVTMANGAQDPWNKEYHGWYITNAENDKQDRGAIVMYSNGANQEFGSEHSIANGLVRIVVPGNNKLGKDDYALATVYTYLNGYGEVKNMTTGFSNNQTFLTGGNNVELPNTNDVIMECGHGRKDAGDHSRKECGHYNCQDTDCGCVPASCGVEGHWSGDGLDHTTKVNHTGSQYATPHTYACQCTEGWTVPEGGKYTSADGTIYNPGDGLPEAVNNGDTYQYGDYEYRYLSESNGWRVSVRNRTKETYGPILEEINGVLVTDLKETFMNCNSLTTVPILPKGATNLYNLFANCKKVKTYVGSTDPDGDFSNYIIPDGVTNMRVSFYYCEQITVLPRIPDGVTDVAYAFQYCTAVSNLENYTIPSTVTNMENTFKDCTSLSGTIKMNATPSNYNFCFGNVDMSKITLAGSCSSTIKQRMANTGINGGEVTIID